MKGTTDLTHADIGVIVPGLSGFLPFLTAEPQDIVFVRKMGGGHEEEVFSISL